MTGPDPLAWFDAMLASAFTDAMRLGPSTWWLGRESPSIGQGRPDHAEVAVARDWVSVEAGRWPLHQPEGPGSPADPLRLLAANAVLDHDVKFVLAQGTAEPTYCLRADLPLHRDPGGADAAFVDGLAERLRRTRSALRHAARRVPAGRRRTPVSSMPPAEVLAHLRDLGWPAHGGLDGPVRVDLDGDMGAARQATIGMDGDHLRLALDLRADLPGQLDDPARTAIAILLLRAGDAVPWVRPLTRNWQFIGFEIVAPTPVASAELDCALGALSLAARLTGAEAEALAASPDLARAYVDACQEFARAARDHPQPSATA